MESNRINPCKISGLSWWTIKDRLNYSQYQISHTCFSCQVTQRIMIEKCRVVLRSGYCRKWAWISQCQLYAVIPPISSVSFDWDFYGSLTCVPTNVSSLTWQFRMPFILRAVLLEAFFKQVGRTTCWVLQGAGLTRFFSLVDCVDPVIPCTFTCNKSKCEHKNTNHAIIKSQS